MKKLIASLFAALISTAALADSGLPYDYFNVDGARSGNLPTVQHDGNEYRALEYETSS